MNAFKNWIVENIPIEHRMDFRYIQSEIIRLCNDNDRFSECLGFMQTPNETISQRFAPHIAEMFLAQKNNYMFLTQKLN